MIIRNLQSKDTPWELIAIASFFFGPGMALVLYQGPPHLFKRGHLAMRSFTPVDVHTVGWCALGVAVALVALYFYARWSVAIDSTKVSRMVTVANCFNITEAHLLQMALNAANIQSFIPDEATATNAPYIFTGTQSGVRVQVAEEDVAEADEIISSARRALKDDNNPFQDDQEDRL
jgi:hypothetical protein